MNEIPSNQPADERAAEWAARLDAGPLTRAEAGELRAWLEAGPGHETRLHEFQQLHGRVEALLPHLVAAGRVEAPERAPSRAARTWWRRAAGLAAVLAAAAVWFARQPERIGTEFAQRQAVTFADGTLVELNARTVLAARMARETREVRLERGEAFFSVASDPARPFTVETPAGRVRVTGTAFNVRIADGGLLQVLVQEGSVEVTPQSKGVPLVLKPGDSAHYDGARTEVRHLTENALAYALAWRRGQIVFDGVPLGEAMDRIARHHGREIEVTAGAAVLRLGGRFGLDDLDGFLRDLELALPVSVLKAGDGRVRIVAR